MGRGLAYAARLLSYQLLLGREIFVTEQMDMHLVWTTGLDLLSRLRARLSLLRASRPSGGRKCDRRVQWKTALGFLFSYAALISHESDSYVARDKHLLLGGEEITWQRWRTLVRQLDTERIYPVQSASYGFAVFSILALVAIGLVVLVFFCMFVYNWVVTVAYKKRRFHVIRARLERHDQLCTSAP